MTVCWRGAGGDMNKFAFQIISQLQCGGMWRRPGRTPPNQLQAAQESHGEMPGAWVRVQREIDGKILNR